MAPRLLALLLLVFALGDAAPAQGKGARRGARGKGAKGRPAAKAAPQAAQPAPAPAAKSDAEPARQSAAKGDDDRELKRGERIEFDGRLIEGQTAASGAIYLFERLPSELRSMVVERKSYRRESLETLYPNGAAPGASADRPGERSGGR